MGEEMEDSILILPFEELMLWPRIKKTKLEALTFLYPTLLGRKRANVGVRAG